MDLGLRGRVAVVCAASQGLGKAVAVGLAREGAHVAMCSRDAGRIEAAARDVREAGERGSRVLPLVADLTRAEDIDALFERVIRELGAVDILVNNAGGPPVASFPELDDSMWGMGIALNLFSTIRCIRAVLPGMRKRRWGRIVTITSITARQPIDDLVISSTIRPGVLGLTKVLANQYGKDGILINAVAPGFIFTERQKEISVSRAEARGVPLEEYIGELACDIPVHRLGDPAELANVIVFLCSDRASYVHGATIAVDGGLTRGLY